MLRPCSWGRLSACIVIEGNPSLMPRVRTHTVRRDGKTHTRRQHERRGGWKARPDRAWRNIKRANLSAKQRKHWTAALFATAAVTELAVFGGLKIGGGLLFVTGFVLCLLGAGLRART